jgi:hypothetical protein
MSPQPSLGNPKPDAELLALMTRQRALLIASILTLTGERAPAEAPDAALLEATKLALHQRALTLIREWGTDRAWAIVAATEAAVMLAEVSQ